MPDPPPEDDPLHGHKLCGFFRAILSVSSPPQEPKSPPKTLAPGITCSLFSHRSNIGFRSEDGILLLPLQDANARAGHEWAEVSKKKRLKGVVLVNGSLSVVHQLHSLTVKKCLKIEARVVRVSVRGDRDTRAVVLVDVYLPIAVWSGWQFPKSGNVAASLFKHVSCNWEVRSSLLASDWNVENCHHVDDECIWSYSDCHVLGCKMCCNIFGFGGRKMLFDLHEIFKCLPSVGKEEEFFSTRVKPENASLSPGIWNVTDDVLTNVLAALGPRDLVSVAATCRHLRSLTLSVVPYMKLKLFPHQRAAIEWMLQRERNAKVLEHPLYMDFSTEDGFSFYVNSVSGEISTGMVPTIHDVHGGMLCDEPGLGKTVTALSLILKTHGTLVDPPHGVDVTWCMHNPDRRCGYYELSAYNFSLDHFMSTWNRSMGQNGQQGEVCSTTLSQEFSYVENSKSSSLKKARSMGCELTVGSATSSCGRSVISPCKAVCSLQEDHDLGCHSSLSCVNINLLDRYRKKSGCFNKEKATENGTGRTNILDDPGPWFRSMNRGPLHESCVIPEESWESKKGKTYLPGFCRKGTLQGKWQNVSFFANILKEQFTSINSETKESLSWLGYLPYDKLLEMETIGLTCPVLDEQMDLNRDTHGYHKIFQALGLVRRVERGTNRWYCPCAPVDLVFDLYALIIALTKQLNMFKVYLSRATLIVVPVNLVDHWKTQIEKHVTPGHLRVYFWNDHYLPSAHEFARDYDVVITTYKRLSGSGTDLLMQVHWLRVILDEGHTLGPGLIVTTKLQRAISLVASNRWILTGRPTPNRPNGHVAHLQPMLMFLHEEVYGQIKDSWVAGILRPFEAQMEEGRSRLLQLLRRITISAKKKDLKTVPPCLKKVTFLHFTEDHARSYNELVVTVQQNILMADWNDPSHVESLLSPVQLKFRRNTIRNIRLACCVAGQIQVTIPYNSIQETMDKLMGQGISDSDLMSIDDSLLNGCSCFRCKGWCRLPVITPCKHLLCLDCVALDSEKCTFPGCSKPYEMHCPEISACPENPSPKWPISSTLIQLQPFYEQDNWIPDWRATSSSKVSYLIERLKELQEANKKIACCVDKTDDSVVLLPFQKSHNCLPERQETATYLVDELSKTLPKKVIIFSQFLEHIHVIEHQLTIAGIKYAGLYSPMQLSNKMKSLMSFQHDFNCMALLMDGRSALGLDLSFATHLFLMEPISDRSLEEQVTSRAYRMGATRPIYVETLAIHGTIEEQMLAYLQPGGASDKSCILQGFYSSNSCGTFGNA